MFDKGILSEAIGQVAEMEAELPDRAKSIKKPERARKFRKELYPYIPDGLKDAPYDPETEMLTSRLPGSDYHFAVISAMCAKQRAESADPLLPVIGYDAIKSEKSFAYEQRLMEPGALDFMLLCRDVGRIHSLILIGGNDADRADAFVTAAIKGVHGVSRAAMVTDPKLAAAATAEEFKMRRDKMAHALRDPDDRYCFIVRFADTIAAGMQKPEIGVWRDYNALCTVCKKEGENVTIDNVFSCNTVDRF